MTQWWRPHRLEEDLKATAEHQDKYNDEMVHRVLGHVEGRRGGDVDSIEDRCFGCPVQDMWGSSLTRGKEAYLKWGEQRGQILRNVLEEQLFV